MIRLPRDFKPLMDQLSSATRHRETVNRRYHPEKDKRPPVRDEADST